MEKSDLLDKYFEGTLTARELEIFERLIKEDNKFAAAFEFQQNIQKAILLHERATLKRKLQVYERDSTKPKKITWWGYAVASVIILIGAAIWVNLLFNPQEKLYAKYYQPYPNTVAPTVRGQQNETLKTEAFYAYDNGDYEKAHERFSALYQQDKEDYALFYQGVSLMELGRFKEAITLFGQYPNNGLFTDYAVWYQALSYLKENEEHRARRLLETLSASQSPMRSQAIALLNDME